MLLLVKVIRKDYPVLCCLRYPVSTACRPLTHSCNGLLVIIILSIDGAQQAPGFSVVRVRLHLSLQCERSLTQQTTLETGLKKGGESGGGNVC